MAILNATDGVRDETVSSLCGEAGAGSDRAWLATSSDQWRHPVIKRRRWHYLR